MTTRLSMTSLAGTPRTLVAVGTVRDVSMLPTTRAAGPRSTTASDVGAGVGVAGTGAAGVAGAAAGAAVAVGALPLVVVGGVACSIAVFSADPSAGE